jgi:hypothetical protein
MTLSLAAEKRLRGSTDEIIDYDASDHVITAASAVLGWHPTDHRTRRALFNLVQWGYGSAVAVEYDELRRRTGSDAAATAAFYASCQLMACTLFPALGGTPPPWRWRRSVLLSSLGQHLLYAVTVAAVSRRLRARSRSS